MNINPLDQPGVPFVIELFNPNVSSRRTKDGPVRRVSFEVSKEVYEAFMDAAESNLRLIGKLAVAPDTDEQPAHDAVNGTKPKKERKPKARGPFGFMWEYLYPRGKHEGRGFVSLPGVREAIEEARETATQPAWEILHNIFGVNSLATVGPDEIYAEFPPNEYPQVKTMVERAMRKVTNNDSNSKSERNKN